MHALRCKNEYIDLKPKPIFPLLDRKNWRGLSRRNGEKRDSKEGKTVPRKRIAGKGLFRA
jgi:hypothetical protein